MRLDYWGFCLDWRFAEGGHADAMQAIETGVIPEPRYRGNAAEWRLGPALAVGRFSPAKGGTPMANVIVLVGRALVTMCTTPDGI